MIALNTIYATIQGEGRYAGVPMVLVRTQGCAVGCPWCDTKETWNPHAGKNVEEHEIARQAREMAPAVRWALLTGGEPAEQNLMTLVFALHCKDFKVLLETSGTARGHVGTSLDWVCVSPKFDMPHGRRVFPDILAAADEIKMVIGSTRDIERLDRALEEIGRYRGVISLQPVSQSEKATSLCMAVCLARGWNLSLQMHKYINVR
jgi:7-carboxy-7-deazaguanine synthase